MPNEEGLLQPHELAERGMGPAVFGPMPATTAEVQIMDFDMNRTRFGPGNVYKAEEDVIETLPDGRQIQVAVKGAEMPMADAVRLGLVKVSAQPAPSEAKVVEPSEAKGAAAEKAEEAEAPAKAQAEAPKNGAKK